MSVVHKSKSYYPQEEIIDGFSILCFDDYKNLNKFLQSKKEDIQQQYFSKSSLSNRKGKTLNEAKKVIKPKSELKVVTPTRITAQRKSKPDISIFSLSMCKRKRPNHMELSVKDLDQEIREPSLNSPLFIDTISDMPKNDINVLLPLKRAYSNLKGDIKVIVKSTFDMLSDDGEYNKEILDEVSDKSYNDQHECCSNHFHKDDSIMGDNSIAANSTLSPVSIQHMHFMQFESESIDLNSPEKIELDHDEYFDNVDLVHEQFHESHEECVSVGKIISNLEDMHGEFLNDEINYILDQNYGDTGEDIGGNIGEDIGGDTREDTSGDTREVIGGDTREDTGGDTREDTSGDTREDTGGDNGEDTSGDTREDTSGDTREDTGGDTREYTGGDTREYTGGDNGEDTGGDNGENTGGDNGEDTGGDNGEDTGGNIGGETGEYKVDTDDVNINERYEHVEYNQEVTESHTICDEVDREPCKDEGINLNVESLIDKVQEDNNGLIIDLNQEDFQEAVKTTKSSPDQINVLLNEYDMALPLDLIIHKFTQGEVTKEFKCDIGSSHDQNNNRYDKELKVCEENDCMIISVGFDPYPKFTNIPISPYLLDVPKLEPAPSISFDFESLPLQSAVSVNDRLPPLIPAPTQYFTSLDYHDSQLYPINTEISVCPKFKTRKRRQMKSSILKPPPKPTKDSPGNVSIRSNTKSQFIFNRRESVTQASIEDSAVSNKQLYTLPSHSVKSIISPPPITKYTMPLYSKPAYFNSGNYDMKLLKPIATKSCNIIQPSKCHLGPSQCFIRKTICHVHIAQSIQRKLILDHTSDNVLVNINGLIKPRPLRPITESLNPFKTLSSFNAIPSLNSSSSIVNKSFQQLPYNRKSIQPYNIPKCSEDFAVLLKPMHNPIHIPNTFNSRCPNSLNMYPNVLLLK